MLFCRIAKIAKGQKASWTLTVQVILIQVEQAREVSSGDLRPVCDCVSQIKWLCFLVFKKSLMI